MGPVAKIALFFNLSRKLMNITLFEKKSIFCKNKVFFYEDFFIFVVLKIIKRKFAGEI